MVLSYSISQCGNLYPRVYNCIHSLPDIALRHSEHDLRHPLAIYTISLGRVTQALKAVLNAEASSSEMKDIAERISHLPSLFFRDEVSKPTPAVALSEHDQDVTLVLTSTSPLRATSFSTWTIQIQYPGDNVTKSWKLPYMGI